MRLIYKNRDWRIIERPDDCTSLECLKGDTYSPEANPSVQNINAEEAAFEALVATSGVYGYELERWNPEVDKGWEHVDSCFGFVGRYSHTEQKFRHYIVDELIKQTK